jgi:hypothetical protein
VQVVSRETVSGDENKVNTGAVLAIVGGTLGVLQVLVLFILSDLRERIMRLETGQMTKSAAGD